VRGGGGKGRGKKHVSCVRRHEQCSEERPIPPQLRRIVIGHDAYTIINDCENKKVAPCHGGILLFTKYT
jgi:hypothetical protein